MDGGQDEFVYSGALLIREVAASKVLGKPVCTASFVITGAGIVDYIMGPQGQFQAKRICGEVSVMVQPSQAGGDVVQGVVVAVGLAVVVDQLLPGGLRVRQ